jgi:hypothetical protein
MAIKVVNQAGPDKGGVGNSAPARRVGRQNEARKEALQWPTLSKLKTTPRT